MWLYCAMDDSFKHGSATWEPVWGIALGEWAVKLGWEPGLGWGFPPQVGAVRGGWHLLAQAYQIPPLPKGRPGTSTFYVRQEHSKPTEHWTAGEASRRVKSSSPWDPKRVRGSYRGGSYLARAPSGTSQEPQLFVAALTLGRLHAHFPDGNENSFSSLYLETLDGSEIIETLNSLEEWCLETQGDMIPMAWAGIAETMRGKVKSIKLSSEK